MTSCDFLVLGGGVAGLSAAARLARHGRVTVLEAEDALGYHSSGRSVSFSHFGIGNAVVRGMTAWSRPFFEQPPQGFSETPLARLMATVYAASEEQVAKIDALAQSMAAFTDKVERIGPERIRALCPVARTGTGHAVAALYDPTGLKIEAAALLQGYARTIRGAGSEMLTGRRAARIERTGGVWQVTTEAEECFSAPTLINAAGAWADKIAALAGVAPIGLQPKRRTIIVVDPPAGMEIASWPFFHSAGGDFYMLPEAGQILVSPEDEVDDEPSDAVPEEYDAALAAYQLEQHTTLTVTRIAHRWAGLRSFVADRVPTAGFDPEVPGFFWLVGQGGYGLQTAPAMAAIVEALAAGGAWPEGLSELGVTRELVGPARLRSVFS